MATCRMGRTRTPIVLLTRCALPALLVLQSGVAPDTSEFDDVTRRDDECAASGAEGDGCAVSVLQRRAGVNAIRDTAGFAASEAAAQAAAAQAAVLRARRAVEFFDRRTASLAQRLTAEELRLYRQRFLEHVAVAAAGAARGQSGLAALPPTAQDMRDQTPPLELVQQDRQDFELALSEQQPAVTEWMALAVTNKTRTWQASVPKWAFNVSMADAKKIMGHITDPTLEHVPQDELEELGADGDDYLPANFDSRDAWPHCREVLSHVRDQGKCGSCWAQAAANTMDGRLCIASEGLFSGPRAWISAAYLTSCYNINSPVMGTINGCTGGNPGSALQAASRSLFNRGGVPTGSARQNTCVPWFGYGNALTHFFGDNIKAPACPGQCTSKEGYPRTLEADKFYPSGKVQVSENFEDLKRSLVQGGPIPFALTVYRDFMMYMGGYYERTTDEKVGDHAATALGYERYEGEDYIIGMNSWGHFWGDGTGVFKMKATCCGISYYLPQINGDQSGLPLPGDGTSGSSPGGSTGGNSSSDGQQCNISTGGSCWFFKCYESRGPTRCKLGQCQCQVGHCAYKGACFPSGDFRPRNSSDPPQPPMR